MQRRRYARRIAAASVAVGALVAGSLAAAGNAAAQPGIRAHQIKVNPEYTRAHGTASAMFSCQTTPLATGPRCYIPSQIQSAYGVTPLYNQGYDGSGSTIAIIDAFGSPWVNKDLQTFDTKFGLSAPDFQQIAPYGKPAKNTFTMKTAQGQDELAWAGEVTLDVLWAHAIAPGAKIVLAIAKSDSDVDIFNTLNYVVDHNLADVISQSFGEAESCIDPKLRANEHAVFAQAASQGITVFASAGDSGASQPDCSTGTTPILSVSTPASDPLVTGVGGTTLNATLQGQYAGETAWTEGKDGITCNPPDADDINCSGGGYSRIYQRPAFQDGITSIPSYGRGVPDVAYNAAVNGGVLTPCTPCNIESGLPVNQPIFFFFGGTSAGSPQWSGLIAIADQMGGQRVGDINPALYALIHKPNQYYSAFHDVTVGNNFVADLNNEGYQARPGWDAVTGLGSPNAAQLLPRLAK